VTNEAVGTGYSFRGVTGARQLGVFAAGGDGQLSIRPAGSTAWQEITVPGAEQLEFRDIDVRAVEPTSLYAMAAGDGEASALYRGEFSSRRTAHELTWRRVLDNPDADGFFDGLAFDSEGLGMLVGDPIGGSFTIILSQDGLNWRKSAAGRAPLADDGEYAFAASGSILISTGPGQFWLATGGLSSHIWRTDSGGSVWFDTGAPEVGGKESSGWFGLGVSDAGLLLAVGGDYATPEAPAPLGRWDETQGWIVDATAFSGFRSAICAVPDRPGTWVAVGSHGADWSKDDGRSWQSLAGIPGGHALSPAGPGSVLVVGSAAHPHRSVYFPAPNAPVAE